MAVSILDSVTIFVIAVGMAEFIVHFVVIIVTIFVMAVLFINLVAINVIVSARPYSFLMSSFKLL